jgi:hypothetical protein
MAGQKLDWSKVSATAEFAKCKGDGCKLTAVNHILASRAFDILGAEPEFSALTQPPRLVILSELGRIQHPEDLKTVAREVIQADMKSKRARIYIQTRRQTRRAFPTPYRHLCRAIDEFTGLHPGYAGAEAIIESLEMLLAGYKEIAERENETNQLSAASLSGRASRSNPFLVNP